MKVTIEVDVERLEDVYSTLMNRTATTNYVCHTKLQLIADILEHARNTSGNPVLQDVKRIVDEHLRRI